MKVNGIVPPYFPYTYVFDNATEVVLEAIPALGHNFVQWEGCVSGSENPITTLVNSPTGATAIFSGGPTNGINGSVWEDTNHDGIQDITENRLEGIAVELYNSDSNFIRSTSTTNGYYSFEGLASGSYYVFVDIASPFIFTKKSQGENNNLDSDFFFNGRTSMITVGDNGYSTYDAGVFSYTSTHSNIQPQEAKNLIESHPELIIIDVREAEEFCNTNGHIPGAVLSAWESGNLENDYEKLPLNSPILLVCRSGHRSNHAAELLNFMGYTSIYNMIGGMNLWQWETEPCEGLTVDFGQRGLWHYNGIKWDQLANLNVENIEAIGDSLIADFGNEIGIWLYNGTFWTRLTKENPDNGGKTILSWNNGLVVDFGPLGLWFYNNDQWEQLSATDIDSMFIFNNNLIVDAGEIGLWSYDSNSWQQLLNEDADNSANSIVLYDSGLAVDFGDFGLWYYANAQWNQLAQDNVDAIHVFNNQLLVDDGAQGIWTYENNLLWTKLCDLDVDNSGSSIIDYQTGVVIDFGTTGLKFYNGNTSDLLFGGDVQYMGKYGDTLVVSLLGSGLWEYDANKWKHLATETPDLTENPMVSTFFVHRLRDLKLNNHRLEVGGFKFAN